MAEFKRLGDVEVVEDPSDVANVLIEEDGVIKKAPKTAVGGNGETLDLYLIINGTPSANTISIAEGSFDALLAAYNNNGFTNVRIDLKDSYGSSTNIRPTVFIYNGFFVLTFVRAYASDDQGHLFFTKCSLEFTEGGMFLESYVTV
jgi:hypothetical protein